MHVHFLHAVRPRIARSSKDTNGGFGTVNDFGRGPVSVLLTYFKRGRVYYPEILPAYLNALLKRQGHTVTYAQNSLNPSADLVLIQTSIVNYAAEMEWAERVRRTHPQVKIGFIGGMSAANPQFYLDLGDFVVQGEPENALLTQNIADFSGLVQAGLVQDLDRLPFPDWSYLQRVKNGYGLLRTGQGCFLPMLSSRGCPMSCGFYCTYPLTQGSSFRARSPENVIEEIGNLQAQYGMTGVMFRDPIFSLDMTRVQRLCELILENGLKVLWICETHPRFLTPVLVQLMARAGCVAVKLGIESGDVEVMRESRRAAPNLLGQEEVIRCLEANHIRVLAFYILGYFDDTPQSIQQTIDYATRLNTYGAQFTIATPYPGTAWHRELSCQPERFALDQDLEHYNQYRLVYNHPGLSFDDLERLKSHAYRLYYLRWPYIKKHFLRL